VTVWQPVIDDILRKEGEAYTNHPSDRGGPTKWGITMSTLSAARGRQCMAADVQALTRAEAYSIYETLYVMKPGFAQIAQYLPEVAKEVIDSGVNCGQARAAKWLQRALNAFNRGARDYVDINVDGRIGPATLASIKGLIAKRGIEDANYVLLRAINAQQGVHYLTLGEAAQSQEDFMFGWFRHRVQ